MVKISLLRFPRHALGEFPVPGRAERTGRERLRLSALEQRRTVHPVREDVHHRTERADLVHLPTAHPDPLLEDQPPHLGLDDLVHHGRTVRQKFLKCFR